MLYFLGETLNRAIWKKIFCKACNSANGKGQLTNESTGHMSPDRNNLPQNEAKITHTKAHRMFFFVVSTPLCV